MAASATSLPFREQSEFFRRKLNIPTRAYSDIYGREHDYSFMVAGANRDDLVQDFRQAVEKAINDGTTLETFRSDFDAIVAKYGWSYNGGRNWRSRVIYETNLRSSYMAGRYEQLMAVRESRPYWQYIHNDAVEHPRPLHESWNGLILRWDDPWWQTHFPVNAWGCQCTVRALSEADLKRMGKSGPDESPSINYVTHTIGQRSPGGARIVEVPEGIDPGFEYTPGQSRLESQVPRARPDEEFIAASVPGLPNRPAGDLLPDPRYVSESRLVTRNFTGQQLSDYFLDAFDAQQEANVFRDVIGERIAIGPQMINTEFIQFPATVRSQYVPLLIDAITQPDEIWVRLDWLDALQKAVVHRRYIAQFNVEGEARPVLAVVEIGEDGIAMITRYISGTEFIDDVRQGIRLYRREQ